MLGINTPAFESLERYNRLDSAVRHILQENGLHPYEWMRPFLVQAMTREKNYMLSNLNNWKERAED